MTHSFGSAEVGRRHAFAWRRFLHAASPPRPSANSAIDVGSGTGGHKVPPVPSVPALAADGATGLPDGGVAAWGFATWAPAA